MSSTGAARPSQSPEMSEGSQRLMEVSPPDVRKISDVSEDCHSRKNLSLPKHGKYLRYYQGIVFSLQPRCARRRCHIQSVLYLRVCLRKKCWSSPDKELVIFLSFQVAFSGEALREISNTLLSRMK